MIFILCDNRETFIIWYYAHLFMMMIIYFVVSRITLFTAFPLLSFRQHFAFSHTCRKEICTKAKLKNSGGCWTWHRTGLFWTGERKKDKTRSSYPKEGLLLSHGHGNFSIYSLIAISLYVLLSGYEITFIGIWGFWSYCTALFGQWIFLVVLTLPILQLMISLLINNGNNFTQLIT